MNNRHEMREDQLQQVRTYLKELGVSPTQLARMAGIAPSTLSRFLHHNVDHLLSLTTMSSISGAYGVEVERRSRQKYPNLYSEKHTDQLRNSARQLSASFSQSSIENLIARFRMERLDFDSEDPALPLRTFFLGDEPRDELPVLGSSDGTSQGFSLKDGMVHGYVPRPNSLMRISSAYAVYMSDSSMEPRYYPGELLYVNPCRPARPADFVVLKEQHGHGSVFQLLARNSNRFTLAQLNPWREISLAAATIKYAHLIIGTLTHGG